MLVLLIDFALIVAEIIRQKKKKLPETSTIVVLGAALKQGNMTSVLINRLQKTLEIMKQVDGKVILSGGITRGNTVAEAERMRQWLLEHGAEESRILLEDQSRTTVENFSFTKKRYFSQVNTPRILVITSGFHMYRSLVIAGKAGFQASGVSVPTPRRVLIKNYGRELLAVIYYYLMEILMCFRKKENNA